MHGIHATSRGNTLSFFLPLSKKDDDKHMAYGYASTEAEDYDGETITLDALEGALPDYMKFANIREMHQLSAVGVAKEASMDAKGLYIGAKVVDEIAWVKVKEGVYKGFSIGGRALERDPKNRNIITKLELIEISLVDRPANPEALIEVFKATTALEPAALSRAPVQNWDCGIPGHVHTKKEESLKCIQADDEKVGDTVKSVALNDLRLLAKNQVAALDGPGLAGFLTPVEALLAPAEVQVFSKAKAIFMPAKPEPNVTIEVHSIDADTAAKVLAENGDKITAAVAKAVEDAPTGVMTAERLRALAGQPAGPIAAEQVVDPTVKRLRELAGQKTSAVVMSIPEAVAKATTPGEIVGTYGDHAEVYYADIGHQADKKPRFPLKEAGAWSPRRIKSAYNYLDKAENQKGYTPEQLTLVKNWILEAYKAAVDPNGPPSAQSDGVSKAADGTIKPPSEDTEVKTNVLEQLGKADAKTDIRKGLSTCCFAISLLQQIDYLVECLEVEAGIEGDHSAMPGRFEEVLTMMAELIKALLEEEVEEMLENKEAGDMEGGAFLAYAAGSLDLTKKYGATGEKVAQLFAKALGDKTGSPAFDNLVAFAAAISKAPSTQTQTWDRPRPTDTTGTNDKWPADVMKSAQAIHDSTLAMGACCTTSKAADAPVADVDTSKADKKDDKKADDKDDDKDKKKDDTADKAKNPDKPKDDGKDDKKDDDDADKKKTKKGDDVDDAADDKKKDDKKKADEPTKAASEPVDKAAAPSTTEAKIDALAGLLLAIASDVGTLKSTIGDRKNPRTPGVAASGGQVDKTTDSTVVNHAQKPADPTDKKEVWKSVMAQPHVINRG